MESNEVLVATGGIAWSSDMGRCREKKDDIFTSVRELAGILLCDNSYFQEDIPGFCR